MLLMLGFDIFPAKNDFILNFFIIITINLCEIF